MKFSINLHTIKTEGSIDRLQVIISKTIAFLSLKIDFVSANRPDPDAMPHSIRVFAVCQSIRFKAFLVYKG